MKKKISVVYVVLLIVGAAAVTFFIARKLYWNVYSRMSNSEIDRRISLVEKQKGAAGTLPIGQTSWFKGNFSTAERIRELDSRITTLY